jgi:hypothetical protein
MNCRRRGKAKLICKRCKRADFAKTTCVFGDEIPKVVLRIFPFIFAPFSCGTFFDAAHVRGTYGDGTVIVSCDA